MDKTKHSILKRIAFIGNYAPRQCGIATFTTDLCEAMADEYKGTACIALPVTETEEGYDYPPRVRFELVEKDVESYRRAADTSIAMATGSVRAMLQGLEARG